MWLNNLLETMWKTIERLKQGESISIVDACPNAMEMWKTIERLKQGESIIVQDLETSLFWEFGKFTSRDGETLDSYYSRMAKVIITSGRDIQAKGGGGVALLVEIPVKLVFGSRRSVMDLSSSVGKTCLGKNVIEISSDKAEGHGDWNSPEF
ncbi:hypothetical protein Tco_1068308 [Tanacetum coccineum]|uniref:Uncharacterized protein n=1 Tax=Tanacetum coccineum TaxID=301880 RepID=A0ABQ5HGT5_9ASTR